MKKAIIRILIMCALLVCLSGCGKDYEEAKTSDFTYSIGSGYFTTIKEWGDVNNNYIIVYANDTKVMYFILYDGYRFGITPLYNVDGTLQVYSEMR